jgi:hypothetical protein
MILHILLSLNMLFIFSNYRRKFFNKLGTLAGKYKES